MSVISEFSPYIHCSLLLYYGAYCSIQIMIHNSYAFGFQITECIKYTSKRNKRIKQQIVDKWSQQITTSLNQGFEMLSTDNCSTPIERVNTS